MSRVSVKNPFTALKEQAASLAGAGNLSNLMNSGGTSSPDASIIQESDGNRIDAEGNQTHFAMWDLDTYGDPTVIMFRSGRKVRYYK